MKINRASGLRQNKPNSNPIKPNFKGGIIIKKMNIEVEVADPAFLGRNADPAFRGRKQTQFQSQKNRGECCFVYTIRYDIRDMLTKDIAICIRALDYSETSQIVTLFTRATGKIKAIAKGSKRPKSAFDGPIELFSCGKIVFSDSTKEKLATLTEFEQQPGFTHLSANLFAFNCCLLGTELLSSLTNDYDPHPQLFDSFLQFLQDTNEGRGTRDERRGTRDEGRRTLALLILFQLALLKEVGLQPILNTCANCKTRYAIRGTRDQRRETKDETNWSEVYFSSSANGLICRDCEDSFPDKIRLTKDAAGCLANLKMIAESDEKTLDEVEKILVHHFTNTLGRPPKMAKHITRGS